MTDEELRRALRAPLTLTVMAELARKGLVSVYPAVETRPGRCPFEKLDVFVGPSRCGCLRAVAMRLRRVRGKAVYA